MGNKAAKAATPKEATGSGVRKSEGQGGFYSPESSPTVPAHDLGAEETVPVAMRKREIDPGMMLGGRAVANETQKTETETAEEAGVVDEPRATSEAVPDVSKVEEREKMTEVPSVAPEAVVDEAKDEEAVETPAVPVKRETEPMVATEEDVKTEAKAAPGGVAMPALDLEKVHQTPPEPEPVQEDDPNLLSPPPFLTDAISSLKDTEKTGGDAAVRPIEHLASEEVLLATPITHDEVSLVEPTPASSPIEPQHRDDISIDEEVSAISEELPAVQSKGSASEDVVSSSADHPSLGHVPEDAVSLTSSVARGEDELLKNIMGVSTTMPALTSNESVRGSVAVSEMTFDENQWDFVRRADSTDKPPMPFLVTIALNVSTNGSVAVHFCYEEDIKPSVFDSQDDPSAAVATVVESIFARVNEQTVAEPEVSDEVSTSRSAESKAKEESIRPTNVELKPVPEDVTPESRTEVSKAEVPIAKPSATPVSVDLTEENGNVKLTLGPSAEEITKPVPIKLHTTRSEVSDKQLSVELDSPFVHVTDSTELPPTSKVTEGEAEGKKKSQSGDGGHLPSALKTPTSDGTASVDSTSHGTKPDVGTKQ